MRVNRRRLRAVSAPASPATSAAPALHLRLYIHWPLALTATVGASRVPRRSWFRRACQLSFSPPASAGRQPRPHARRPSPVRPARCHVQGQGCRGAGGAGGICAGLPAQRQGPRAAQAVGDRLRRAQGAGAAGQREAARWAGERGVRTACGADRRQQEQGAWRAYRARALGGPRCTRHDGAALTAARLLAPPTPSSTCRMSAYWRAAASWRCCASTRPRRRTRTRSCRCVASGADDEPRAGARNRARPPLKMLPARHPAPPAPFPRSARWRR